MESSYSYICHYEYQTYELMVYPFRDNKKILYTLHDYFPKLVQKKSKKSEVI